MKYKKTIAGVAVGAAIGGGILQYQLMERERQAQEDADWLLMTMVSVNSAILNREPDCKPKGDKPDIVSGDEYGKLPEDSNGLVSDLPALLAGLADKLNILLIGSDSPYQPDGVRMSAEIVQKAGLDIPVKGPGDMDVVIAELAEKYCPENRLTLTSGDAVRWIARTMKRYPDIAWKNKVQVITIGGSNLDPGDKREAFDYVVSIIGAQNVAVVSERDFMWLLTPQPGCDVNCLNTIQAKLDTYISGVCDSEGRCLQPENHAYKEHNKFLNRGQVPGCGAGNCSFRAADVIAPCLTLYELDQCKNPLFLWSLLNE